MQNHERTTALLLAALLAIALLASPAAARDGLAGISAGDTIYVGEEDLDLTGVAPGITRLVHYYDFTAGTVDNIIDVPTANTFDLSAADVGGITGTYYAWGASGLVAGNPFVIVKTPDVTLDVVLDSSRTDSVNGKSVSRDTVLAFKVQNNVNGLYAVPAVAFMDIEVTTPAGGRITQFGGVGTDNVPINASTVYVGGIALTDAAAGTYAAQARWNDATGLAGKGYDSNTVSFEVTTRALSLTANKDAVVRGNPFVVTVTGEAKKAYWLYVRDAGIADDEYPLVSPGQPGVVPGTDLSGVTDAADPAFTRATATTSAAGTRTVQFNTSFVTDIRRFTIKVVDPADTAVSDTVMVAVERGAVSMTASGTGVYSVGEKITLSGTNTDSTTTYLFLCGPNLPVNGARLDNLTAFVVDNSAATFTRVGVETDDTWEYKWDTSPLGTWLDSGCYTIYAASAPRDKAHIADAQYATNSLVLKTPYIAATASASTVARGDSVTFSGTAPGNPDNVYVWIFGKNYRLLGEPLAVESDDSFEYTIGRSVSGSLATGQHFIVFQHPMMNGLQDVHLVPGTVATITSPGTTNVNLANLQATDAATALVTAMNSPNVDDTYTKLTFSVEESWIRIDPLEDLTVDSTFAITGTTNLAPGNDLLIDVVSASFHPDETTTSYDFSGASGTITVREGTPDNVWSFEVDASDFLPDDYIVNVESVATGFLETATFTLDDAPVTPVPDSDATLTLSRGWNFVSVQKRLADGNNTAAKVFGDVDTAGHSLFRYDAAGSWSALAADSAIEPLEGYWVYANRSTAVGLFFAGGSMTQPPSKTLSPGWNAIGFPGAVSASARDTLFSVRNSWTNLIGWDAGLQQYATGVVNGGSGAYSDTRAMEPGQGYWLYTTEGGELVALTG